VIEADDAREAILLPNDRNVVLAAEHAADHASKPTRVLPTRTIQAGLSALVEDLLLLARADAGLPPEPEVVAVRPVLERLLAEPRGLLTLLAGDGLAPLDGLVAELASSHPGLEVEVHEGGQAGYALLLGAE